MKRVLAALTAAGLLISLGLAPALAAATVTSEDIVDQTIRSVDIHEDGVGASEIRADAVGKSEIRQGAVGSNEIAAESVGYNELTDNLRGGLQYTYVPSGRTIAGVVGGDYDAHNNLLDWGVDESFPAKAPDSITDDDVSIVTSTWVDGGGQTQPTTDDGNVDCTGSVSNPTAPAGQVCIYIAGGDNVQRLRGYSVVPGTGGSRFGFKLAWTNTGPGDTFIDAIWAYHAS